MPGGATRPWLVYVNVEGAPLPYVVKMYLKKDIEQIGSVSKDVYCSVLATEMGLETPAPALIKFTKPFIKSLSNKMRIKLPGVDTRLKFGCKLIDATYQYDLSLPDSALDKYDTESIFAFDQLVLNADRNNRKPNILLKGTSAYLIDHEKTLLINQKTFDNFDNNSINHYLLKNHIFYNHLRGRRVATRNEYFKSFSRNLRNLNVDILDEYVYQLEGAGHPIEDYDFIKEYLKNIQQNGDKFVSLLKAELK